jgi:hypothetical protein
MINVITKKPLQVRNEGTAGPYIRLPESQLEEVCQILDRHGIKYWVDELRTSLDGAPFIAVINFGLKGGPDAIQSLLDDGQ